MTCSAVNVAAGATARVPGRCAFVMMERSRRRRDTFPPSIKSAGVALQAADEVRKLVGKQEPLTVNVKMIESAMGPSLIRAVAGHCGEQSHRAFGQAGTQPFLIAWSKNAPRSRLGR